jgi:oligopeptide/dipeptide ABC transporter ATP-binding protein
LFKVTGLRVHYTDASGRTVHSVNGASFEVRQGEVLGMLGESACGKSTIARACLRLLPKSGQLVHGSIQLDGLELVSLTEKEMQKIRGARIALIPQDAGLSLNPVIKVGDQIAEVLRAHRDWSAKRCRSEAQTLLQLVQLNQMDRNTYDAYPHQLSGGQQQRIAIAQALACNPALVIADEPTASLDPNTAAEILDLLRILKEERKLSMLFITHDPRILLGLADRVAIMYAGRIIEQGVLREVFQTPLHPYSKALLACLPPSCVSGPTSPGHRLPAIWGSAPDPEDISRGCTFAPRCSERMAQCDTQHPSPVEIEAQHQVECFLYGS